MVSSVPGVRKLSLILMEWAFGGLSRTYGQYWKQIFVSRFEMLLRQFLKDGWIDLSPLKEVFSRLAPNLCES